MSNALSYNRFLENSSRAFIGFTRLALFVLLFSIVCSRGAFAQEPHDEASSVSKADHAISEPVLSQEEAKAEGATDLATPARQLDFPVLPSMHAVSSLDAPSAHQENAAFLKSIHLDSAPEAVETEATSKTHKQAFEIRFAPLPDEKVQAIPDIRISSTIKERREAGGTTQSAKKVAKKKVEDPTDKEFKALVDMRRRQLEAIETDRRTLAALKQALADLGLTEKLSFMANGQRSSGEPEVLGMASNGKETHKTQ